MVVRFEPKIHSEPVALIGVRGEAGNPQVVSGPGEPVAMPGWNDPFDRPGPDSHAVFSSGKRFTDISVEYNRLAARLAGAGRFPGVYPIADQAWLRLIGCSHLVVENLHFRDCWPTAILIENCQNLTIRNCTFEGGTFAIVARGWETSHVTVENCFWQQDDAWQESGYFSPRMWNCVSWNSIHGDYETAAKEGRPCVNIQTDSRAYDGDFFRGYGVGGNFVFRNNFVRDAFNAIHFYLTDAFAQDDPAGWPIPPRNVLIERNRFLRIRDNTVELENDSTQWVVRHNVFAENYKPIAMEAAHGGFIYVYGNVGWNSHRPGKHSPDGSSTGVSIFKLGKTSLGGGPVYFFHNSWMSGFDTIKKGKTSLFHHLNNAIQSPSGRKGIFGKFANDIDKNFTREWAALGIRFAGDAYGPDIDIGGMVENGYHFTDETLKVKGPMFAAILEGTDFAKTSAEDFRLSDIPDGGALLREKAVGIELQMPGGSQPVSLEAGADIGAWQGEALFNPVIDFPFFEAMQDDVPMV